MNIIQGKPCNSTNCRKNRRDSIKYIVIHYTANNGDTAKNNCDYFANNRNLRASAHYFVDENSIYQSVQDNDVAFHCGTSGKYYSACRNDSSIGIEMCSRKYNGEYYIKDETVTNAINLTKYLMEKYNVSINNVIRHYDVTHKMCPEPFVKHPEQWESFKSRLTEEKIDMEELNKLKNEVEELKAQIAELQTGKHKNEMIYNYIDMNMPEWARESVQWCVNNNIIMGTGEGLGLNDIKIWLCVILHRFAKLFGKA